MKRIDPPLVNIILPLSPKKSSLPPVKYFSEGLKRYSLTVHRLTASRGDRGHLHGARLLR